MPYDKPVGNPDNPRCSLCAGPRVVDPNKKVRWCRRCDGSPLTVSLANRKGPTDA